MRPVKFFLFFMLIIPAAATAQDYRFFVQVKEKSTHLPLISVTVYFDGKPTGVTSVEGFYEKKFTKETVPKEVSFSYIGMKNLTMPVEEANGKTIFMETAPGLQMPQVVVTIARTDQRGEEAVQSIEVLPSELIAQTQPASMDEVIEQRGGIQVLKGQANIRGSSGFTYGAGSRVLLLLDGMPLMSADAGDVKWDYLPLENIEQVEVLKGASSSLYGSSAIGGIIHLRSKSIPLKPQFMVRTGYGVYDRPADTSYYYSAPAPDIQNLQLAYNRMVSKRTGFISSMQYYKDDGYRLQESEERLRFNTLWRTTSKNNKLVFGYGINTMYQQGENFLFAGDMAQPMVPAPGSGNSYKNWRLQADQYTRYYVNDSTRHTLRFRYFGTYNNHSGGTGSNGHLGFGEYLFIKKISAGKMPDINLTTGISHIWGLTRSDSLYGNHQSHNTAAYIQADVDYGNVKFSFGARAERFKTDTFELLVVPVFRSGLSYKLATARYVRASIGQGFRYPSIAERFASANAGGLKIFPNPTLQPERGWSAEVGFRQGLRKKSLQGFFDVAGFITEYYNMMEFVFGLHLPPDYDPNNTFQYIGFASKNVTDARISGIEGTIGGEYELNKWRILAYGSYTFINPINKKFSAATDLEEDQYLKYRSRHIAKSQLQVVYNSLSLTGFMRYQSEILNIDREFNLFIKNLQEYRQQNPADAMVFDVRLGWERRVDFAKKEKTGNLTAALLVKNLFNREYMVVPGNIMPQRSYNVQLELKL